MPQTTDHVRQERLPTNQIRGITLPSPSDVCTPWTLFYERLTTDVTCAHQIQRGDISADGLQIAWSIVYCYLLLQSRHYTCTEFTDAICHINKDAICHINKDVTIDSKWIPYIIALLPPRADLVDDVKFNVE